MKTAFRVLGLTLALAASFYPPASASSGTCFYYCEYTRGYISANNQADCCSGMMEYPCMEGGQGTPYRFWDPSVGMMSTCW